MVLNKLSTTNDALALVGTRVLKGAIKHITFDKKGNLQKNTVYFKKGLKDGSKYNPYLKDGDLIFVGNSLLSNASEVINEVTEPLQGIYSGYRIFELLED